MGSVNAVSYLADLNRHWLNAHLGIPSHCAYEKRPTYGFEIVEMGSASTLCDRGLDPIDTNHIDIVKPADQNSKPYISFKAAYLDEMKNSPPPGPIDDLRLNFHFDLHEPGVAKVSYIFRNLLTQTVLVQGFGLVELFGHSDDVESQNSLSLCNADKTKDQLLALNTMRNLPLPGGTFLRLPFGIVGNQHQAASISDPSQISVDDIPAKEPISIDGGKNKIVVMSFKLASHDWKRTANFWVLCPFATAVDTTGHSASSVCPGYAETLVNNGIITKHEGPNAQFRILPLASAWACPIVD
jgi:hypothetical protein